MVQFLQMCCERQPAMRPRCGWVLAIHNCRSGLIVAFGVAAFKGQEVKRFSYHQSTSHFCFLFLFGNSPAPARVTYFPIQDTNLALAILLKIIFLINQSSKIGFSSFFLFLISIIYADVVPSKKKLLKHASMT